MLVGLVIVIWAVVSDGCGGGVVGEVGLFVGGCWVFLLGGFLGMGLFVFMCWFVFVLVL